MSDVNSLAHKNSGVYGIGNIGTPQSSHVDLHRAESHMSATTNEIARQRSATQNDGREGGNADGEFPTMSLNLADLQDDADKSSLESGQVSPEAFDERQEASSHTNTVTRFNASGGGGPQGGRKDRNQTDQRRMGKRRGRNSRSRSQSPSNFQL